MAWLLGILHRWFPPRPVPVPLPVPPPPLIPPTVPPSALIQVRADVVRAMNVERWAKGLGALRENPQADDVAQSWAEGMAATNTLSHGLFANRITAAFGQVAASEDIADGQVSAQQVVAGWLNSPPHRANIMGNYNAVGIGIAATDQGVLFWCAVFVLMGGP